jgi:hypothetical protein
MSWRRRRQTLKKRYGRSTALSSVESRAVVRMRLDGNYDVVVVDSRGRELHTLAKDVSYAQAISIVRRGHR